MKKFYKIDTKAYPITNLTSLAWPAAFVWAIMLGNLCTVLNTNKFNKRRHDNERNDTKESRNKAHYGVCRSA
jgi:hypothetical protein